MGETLSEFLSWVEAIPALWAYIVLLLVAHFENVFPPIPGDLIVVFGGYLSSVGTLEVPVVIALATLGGTTGFMNVYYVGYYMDEWEVRLPGSRWISDRHLVRARLWTQRWGYGVVLANRYIPGTRTVIALAAGLVKMSAFKCTAYSFLSALTWTTIISYGGYLLGENWSLIAEWLDVYGLIVGGVLILILFGFAIRRYFR